MGGIELAGVSVSFGDVRAVEDVDLRVREGELLVLVGPSGCGKTTLLRTIAGLESAAEGDVFIDGRRVTDLPARKRAVSFVFQDFALFPHLSARENVSFDLRMGGAEDVDERVDEAAALLGIEGLLDRSIDELSGGQRQRVALGRAIVTEPTAFLLDEPLANLDASLRERMRTEIARLQDELGTTTVHVTHDQAEALTMGDRVAVMREGRIEQLGTPEAVYRAPASLFVAHFVGSPAMNLFPARRDSETGLVESGLVETAEGGRPLPVDLSADVEDVTVGIRPEHVAVERSGERGGQWLDATVAFAEFHGADRYLYFETGEETGLVARTNAAFDVAAGEVLSIRFPPDRLHLFDGTTGNRIPAERWSVRGTHAQAEGEPR